MEILKKLVVHGKKKTNQDKSISYTLESSNRDADNRHEIDLEGDDLLLELTLSDDAGTTWVVDRSTIHELFPEMDPAIQNSSERGGNEDEFVLPGHMETPSSERGIIGKIVLKVLTIFTKEKVVKEGVGLLAKKLEVKSLYNHIPEDSEIRDELKARNFESKGGELFSLNDEFDFKIFGQEKGIKKIDYDIKKPFFLFIHGTASDTYGAFSGLQGSPAWNTIFSTYGKNVIAYQHRTLTQSPMENALQLAELLPEGARVHILSHSRGGLIGDIINRYSSENENARGFSQKHINLLKKEDRPEAKQMVVLNKIFKDRSITVEKYTRVACPAAGTILASKRLDHMLNALMNLIPGPVGQILKELLMAAVSSKDDINILPGLEAQNPESPFLKVLNDPSKEAAIKGKALAVIAGNSTFSFSGKGLLVILSKLFYWKKNDLVVNTDSMYLGVNREEKIQYFFNQGPEVDHIKYFKNKQTQEAVKLVIETEVNADIPGFKSVFQNEVPKEDRALLEHGELKPDENLPTGKKPIVVLLPGIMGSNLTEKEKELWLHYGRIMTGGLMKLDYSSGDGIEANSVVKTSYNKLYKWLSNKYDVIIYPFDWRKPLLECAETFNTKMKSLLEVANDNKQPIKIISHSMGGVLVRDFIVNYSDTWTRLNATKDFRLIYLGSPLGGSHRILTVMFGRDAIINKLGKLDLFNTKKELLKMFTQFPGILGLLPLTTSKDEDYADLKLWKKMRSYFGDDSWPLPKSEDLDAFRKYRTQVNKWFKDSKVDYSNMVYIAGKDKMTPIGYHLDEFLPKGKERLRFLYTGEGDQSVSWELGIPEKMKNTNSVYYTRVTHGALANEPELFDGIEELLATGKTKLLSNDKPTNRGEQKIFSTTPNIDFDISQEGFLNSILGITPKEKFEEGQIPLNVTIVNGDLRYASFPVLAGHFLNDGILYAEKAVDRYLDYSLSHKHDLGLYPGKIGTSAIFKTNGNSDFAGALIVGMGEQDSLTSQELSKSVEQGVLNYLISLHSQESNSKKPIGISALIMASGYGGLTVENSMKAVINGINQANSKVRGLNHSIYQTVEKLEFIERYSDRALNCMYVINRIKQLENDNYHISLPNSKIVKRLGIWKRIPMDNSKDWWNRVNVKYVEGNEETGEIASMIFGASTSDSRQEESRVYSSTPLIDLFISKASTKNDWDNCTAKTLFELLIPNEMKEKLRRKGNVSWILDEHTASYPWELLQDDAINAKPLCINAGMIRQLSTNDYRKDIKRVADRGALIIADPILDGFIGQLPGAREEGSVVKGIMEENNYPVQALIEEDAAKITTAFFCKNYSIIHLAGHGVFNEKFPNQSGMVIGKNLFISVFHIKQLPVVPEIVFVNCCHLGAVNAEHEDYYRDRYKLAANIGTQLISIGVKAVIAAGWVVNDAAALDFSNKFYEFMFSGDDFGNAVKKARSYIFEKHPGNNTWGAYQCYGDPFFKLSNRSKKEWKPEYIVPQEAEIDLDNLKNDIEMGIGKMSTYLYDFSKIEEAIQRDAETLQTPEVVERQARIYFQLALYEKAKEKFDYLRDMQKNRFSLSALIEFSNARAKYEVQKVYHENSSITAKTKKDAYAEVSLVVSDLVLLLKIGETAERLNMLASTYKRLVMLAPNKKAAIDAMERSMIYYTAAYENFPEENTVYPLTNAIELSAILRLHMGNSKQKRTVTFEEGQYIPNSAEGNGKLSTPIKYELFNTTAAKRQLKTEREKLNIINDETNMDYWTMLADLNIDMCLVMINRNNKNEDRDWVMLEKKFQRIWDKAGSEGKKLAELEHLRILIHALSEATGIKIEGKLPSKGEATIENLSIHINTLRKALGKLK